MFWGFNMFSIYSLEFWLLYFGAGMPLTIIYTIVLLNIMFKPEDSIFVDSTRELIQNRFLVLTAFAVGLFWPIFLTFDGLVSLFLLLVILPIKLTFKILNWTKSK